MPAPRFHKDRVAGPERDLLAVDLHLQISTKELKSFLFLFMIVIGMFLTGQDGDQLLAVAAVH